jgi:signal transduction histidine kinase
VHHFPFLRRERFLFHTMAFRQFVVYALIFCLTFAALLGMVEHSMTTVIQRETSSDLRWQLRYFDGYTNAELPHTINTRIHHQIRQNNYYGLFAADGHMLAGNIRALPAGLTLGQPGQSRYSIADFTLPVNIDSGKGVTAQVMRVVGEYRTDGSRLVVARSLDDEQRIRADLLHMLLASGLICFCGGLAVSILLGLHQLRRINRIHSITASIASGNLDARLPANSHDEIDMLCRLVNQMLDEIRRLMIEVKGTCDVIAHDLRTPLIHLKSRLAALSAASAGHRHISPALALASQDVQTVLDRFAALLRISEIDSLQRRRTFAPVALSTLAEELQTLYAPLAEERQIALVAEVEEVETVLADRELLFEALMNLLDNAIKFTPDGGRVDIALRRTDTGAQFVVSDTGPGIPPAERTTVFTRFYRSAHTASVRNTGQGLNAGLGLGLVAAVVRLHDFALHIGDAAHGKSAGNSGTVITVDCWPHSTPFVHRP